MKLSLYEIEKSQLQLIEALIDNGGEATPELEEALQINKDNLETKSTGYGFIIKQLDAECDIIDIEIKRLTALKKARVNSCDRLKYNISTAMQIFDVEEIKTPLFKISFRKSESVEVDNVDLLDEKFKKTQTTVTADKIAIKEAIKSGEVVIGAVIKSNRNLQIK